MFSIHDNDTQIKPIACKQTILINKCFFFFFLVILLGAGTRRVNAANVDMLSFCVSGKQSCDFCFWTMFYANFFYSCVTTVTSISFLRSSKIKKKLASSHALCTCNEAFFLAKKKIVCFYFIYIIFILTI